MAIFRLCRQGEFWQLNECGQEQSWSNINGQLQDVSAYKKAGFTSEDYEYFEADSFDTLLAEILARRTVEKISSQGCEYAFQNNADEAKQLTDAFKKMDEGYQQRRDNRLWYYNGDHTIYRPGRDENPGAVPTALAVLPD